MTESVSQAGIGETRIEAPISKYWNSKKTPATKGDMVRGIVLRIDNGTYKDKPTSNYVLKGDDGNEIVLPNHALLNGLMSKVPIGKGARVVYVGQGETTKRGRSPPELYEVYMFDAPASSQPPAQPPVQAPASDDTVLTAIIRELKESEYLFKTGIPVDTIASCAVKHLNKAGKQGTGLDVFNTLKTKGLIQPKGDGYGVV